MAGGGGTRFWPYSREEKPKQFLDILQVKKSLLQLTYQRFVGYVKEENIKIVTLKKYENTLKTQLPHLQENQIFLEPNRKNTATCILYACHKIYKQCPDAVLIIVPVDHLIMDEKEFQNCLNTAIEHVSLSEHIITIGIQPTREETGYGYIQYTENKQNPIHKVKTFVEKPNISFVKKFIESKEFVWNAGIFIAKAASFINEYQKLYPEITEHFFNTAHFFDTDKEQEHLTSLYSLCKNISIDFALMEKIGPSVCNPRKFCMDRHWNLEYPLPTQPKRRTKKYTFCRHYNPQK